MQPFRPIRGPGAATRRRFLKTAAAGAGAWCAPWLAPASVFGAGAPSNRVHVGVIGCGHQSQRVIPSFLVHEDVQVLAVCDVHRQGAGYYHPGQVLGRETAREWVDQHYAGRTGAGRVRACDACADFRQALDRSDLDAVAVIVPDHWHALIAVHAARAGKDIYCEKPLALTVREGQAIVREVRKHQRVFQTGAQVRSSPAVRRACELVRNFLDAVKDRKDPINPVEAGHRASSLCTLGNVAQLLKRKFRWDPAQERSPDDEEVNRMLSRPMRAPWKI